ncbi:NB-ARC and TPR domain protein [Colletotrichum musicola]|uniref:NB-ARC and TPR domain protein n=1 Tax=Colletotrichum musicola TaxID=2175873 RepID=A0A8H6K8Q8_9PEZI|nr:NB-ARC and TPR domain protein [Colletotrichum musicola]
MKMLDETHESLAQSSTDHNAYSLESINGYNVVIAGLHGPGNVAAATVVTQMRTTYPNLRYGLLVGIGGGINQAFQSQNDDKSTCFLHIPGEEDAQVDRITGEIEIFTDNTVQALERRKRLNADEKQVIHERLTRVRHRTYLWVHLVCKMLQEMYAITKPSLETFF